MMMSDNMDVEEVPPPQTIHLMDLPTELHLNVASFLTYPDALALKHTCRHFYSIVYTGVHLKVDWLVERFERKLECPMEKCSFRTDESFCNRRIRKIMERRRRHLECRPGRGACYVVEGSSCHRDVVPIWLKKEVRIRILGSWRSWRNEGPLGKIYSFPSCRGYLQARVMLTWIHSLDHWSAVPPLLSPVELALQVYFLSYTILCNWLSVTSQAHFPRSFHETVVTHPLPSYLIMRIGSSFLNTAATSFPRCMS